MYARLASNSLRSQERLRILEFLAFTSQVLGFQMWETTDVCYTSLMAFNYSVWCSASEQARIQGKFTLLFWRHMRLSKQEMLWATHTKRIWRRKQALKSNLRVWNIPKRIEAGWGLSSFRTSVLCAADTKQDTPVKQNKSLPTSKWGRKKCI